MGHAHLTPCVPDELVGVFPLGLRCGLMSGHTRRRWCRWQESDANVPVGKPLQPGQHGVVSQVKRGFIHVWVSQILLAYVAIVRPKVQQQLVRGKLAAKYSLQAPRE